MPKIESIRTSPAVARNMIHLHNIVYRSAAYTAAHHASSTISYHTSEHGSSERTWNFRARGFTCCRCRVAKRLASAGKTIKREIDL